MERLKLTLGVGQSLHEVPLRAVPLQGLGRTSSSLPGFGDEQQGPFDLGEMRLIHGAQGTRSIGRILCQRGSYPATPSRTCSGMSKFA